MMTLKKNLLHLGLLAVLAPAAPAVTDDGYATAADGEALAWVAENLDRMVRGELPSFEGMECEYEACADGCTEECQAKTQAWLGKMEKHPSAYYASLLAKDPVLWEAAAPAIERRFGEKRTRPEERARLLDVVSEVPAALKSGLPASLWGVDSDSFTLEHVLGFASAKSGKVFVKDLARRVAESNAAPAEADVRPALFFAMRGDARGKATLAGALERGVHDRHDAALALLVGQGLEVLGAEGALREQQERVFEETVRALDDGELGRARALATGAKVFASSQKKGKKSGYSWSWSGALSCAADGCEWCDEAEELLASADDVLAAIESVTPL